ncbi:unnamed protein product, partial [Staurois parvus]
MSFQSAPGWKIKKTCIKKSIIITFYEWGHLFCDTHDHIIVIFPLTAVSLGQEVEENLLS